MKRVAVSNGTDALVLALKSLELEPTDEVITVSHTAVATVAAVVNAGGVPVLVDVDDTYFTLDVDQVEKAITKNTRAVIAVHIYGQSAPLSALLKICNNHTASS